MPLAFETRSLPTRSLLPRSFTFYVADPISSIHHFLPSYFLLLPLLGRFQFRAHRRDTDLAWHKTRIGVRDRHALPAFF